MTTKCQGRAKQASTERIRSLEAIVTGSRQQVPGWLVCWRGVCQLH